MGKEEVAITAYHAGRAWKHLGARLGLWESFSEVGRPTLPVDSTIP